MYMFVNEYQYGIRPYNGEYISCEKLKEGTIFIVVNIDSNKLSKNKLLENSERKNKQQYMYV